VTLSTLPYPKSSETQAAPDGTPINYPINLKQSETGVNLSQDAKVSNTFILPGIPINKTVPPLATEQLKKEEERQQHERIPSSRFSAFLSSIRSGLPFFPSKKNYASSVNFAITREHFIPVRKIARLLRTQSIVLGNTSFINPSISY
jgi:hypothetical protein